MILSGGAEIVCEDVGADGAAATEGGLWGDGARRTAGRRSFQPAGLRGHLPGASAPLSPCLLLTSPLPLSVPPPPLALKVTPHPTRRGRRCFCSLGPCGLSWPLVSLSDAQGGEVPCEPTFPVSSASVAPLPRIQCQPRMVCA